MSEANEKHRLDDLVSVRDAAKAVHRDRKFVREFAIKNRIAIPWGGGAERQRIKVPLSELRDLMAAQRVPVEGIPVNPRVRC